ncbi:MAG: DUF3179 domain-containing protein [Anaerolineae bacterium]|nr:DUF3179 domain-containing protein [Anaerolineae bacterium]
MNNFKTESFDLNRAFLLDSSHPPSSIVTKLHPLNKIMAEGQIHEDIPLLVMELDNQAIAFITPQLAYQHIVQGVLNGQAWLVSFCSICNGGAVFSPLVDDEVYSFQEGGFYDAMVLLYDVQSGSYWDHLTGNCLYGSLVGKELKRLSNLLHMSLRQVLAAYPDALLALSALPEQQQTEAEEDEAWRKASEPEWSKGLVKTLGVEDNRLPRLNMGLGVWTETTRRYYPVAQLYAMNNVLIDMVDGQRLITYIDPLSGTPGAFFTDASQAEWQHNILQLNNGDSMRDMVIFDANMMLKRPQRPFQLFVRWYSFALKFPNCEIYGQPVNTQG